MNIIARKTTGVFDYCELFISESEELFNLVKSNPYELYKHKYTRNNCINDALKNIRAILRSGSTYANITCEIDLYKLYNSIHERTQRLQCILHCSGNFDAFLERKMHEF